MSVDPHHDHHGHGHGAGRPPELLVAVAQPVAPADATVAAAAVYTCPMHPEIRLPAPGNCPKCGMALEPEMPTLEEGESAELGDFRKRFWWTLPLTIIVVVLAMGGHVLFPNLSAATRSWTELALATPVVVWAGWPFFERGWTSIRTRNLNMWTLIAIGVAAAYAYSVAATVAPGAFPSGFEAHGRVGVYFEAAAVIVSLTLMGQLLELKARSQTSAAIKALLGLAPRTARRLRDDGTDEDVELAHVHVGELRQELRARKVRDHRDRQGHALLESRTACEI